MIRKSLKSKLGDLRRSIRWNERAAVNNQRFDSRLMAKGRSQGLRSGYRVARLYAERCEQLEAELKAAQEQVKDLAGKIAKVTERLKQVPETIRKAGGR